MFALLLLFALGVYYLYTQYRKLSALPPGPIPLPLIGNLMTQIHPPMIFADFRRLAVKYGSVFTVHMPFPVVNICDYDTLREAFLNHGDDYSDRLQSVINELINFTPNGGITTSIGDMWREQRRTAISILRDFGMGKNLMEEKVKLSVAEYLRCLREKDPGNLENIDMRWPIQLFVANIINEFLFGFRYAYDDCDSLINFVENVTALFTAISKSLLFLSIVRFPWLRKIPIIKEYAFERQQRIFNKFRAHILREIAEAKKTYSEDGEPSCYVHAYLQRGLTNENLTEGQLVDCCTQLFLAGQETTTTTLRWAMLFMATHQEAQDKLREEINRVFGSDRLPSLADKSRMPYTTACLMEIQRKANILAVNFIIMRRTTADTEIRGHHIPAGTVVNPDYHQIHSKDPHFVEPEKFMPERYLEADGVTFKKDVVERTNPFGMGKRQCVGEGLARVELFFGLVATVQNYRILPSKEGPVDLEPNYLNIQLPKQQKLRLEAI